MPFGLAEQQAGLLALDNGNPVDPKWIDWYLEQGYVERVDEVTGTPVDAESPKTVIRVTTAGWGFMQSNLR
ncbi:hypothetical protein NWF24_17705 [Variovorax paradoxus]|uniref:hypothetical protein n=1 Tax=Variovorax paradoxus TaxID=34073 RepID=UPI0021AC70DC|nr:hypothetical protein [Variovorax paradoxus]UVH54682.1 hypothetical protein NWF24_17705 [Variovorax paradoxus]